MFQRVDGYQKPDLYQLRSGGVWDAYIRMEGVKEFYEAVKDKVEIRMPLRKQGYGDWEFEVKDPNYLPKIKKTVVIGPELNCPSPITIASGACPHMTIARCSSF